MGTRSASGSITTGKRLVFANEGSKKIQTAIAEVTSFVAQQRLSVDERVVVFTHILQDLLKDQDKKLDQDIEPKDMEKKK